MELKEALLLVENGKLPDKVSICKTLREYAFSRTCLIRASVFKCMTHFSASPIFLQEGIRLRLPLIACKVFEEKCDYLVDRIEALKYISFISKEAPSAVSVGFVFAAIAGCQDVPAMRQISLQTLMRLAVSHTSLVSYCGGFRVIGDAILNPALSALAPSLIMTLSHLLESPKVRKLWKWKECIEKLLSPFTAIDDLETSARQRTIGAASRAFVLLTRTWAGLYALAANPRCIRTVLMLLAQPVPSILRQRALVMIAVTLGIPCCTTYKTEILHPREGKQFVDGRGHFIGLQVDMLRVYRTILFAVFVDSGLLTALSRLTYCADGPICIQARRMLGHCMDNVSALLCGKLLKEVQTLPELVPLAIVGIAPPPDFLVQKKKVKENAVTESELSRRARVLKLLHSERDGEYAPPPRNAAVVENISPSSAPPQLEDPLAMVQHSTRRRKMIVECFRDKDGELGESVAQPLSVVANHAASVLEQLGRKERDKLVLPVRVGSILLPYTPKLSVLGGNMPYVIRSNTFLTEQRHFREGVSLDDVIKLTNVNNVKQVEEWNFHNIQSVLNLLGVASDKLDAVIRSTKFFRRIGAWFFDRGTADTPLDCMVDKKWDPRAKYFQRVPVLHAWLRALLSRPEGVEFLNNDPRGRLLPAMVKWLEVEVCHANSTCSLGDAELGTGAVRVLSVGRCQKRMGRELFGIIGSLCSTSEGERLLSSSGMFNVIQHLSAPPTSHEYVCRLLLWHGCMFRSRTLRGTLASWVATGSLELQVFTLNYILAITRSHGWHAGESAASPPREEPAESPKRVSGERVRKKASSIKEFTENAFSSLVEWGLPLLVSLAQSESAAVSRLAFRVLEAALDVRKELGNALLDQLRGDWLLKLADSDGVLFRLLRCSRGLHFLRRKGWLADILQLWLRSGCDDYIRDSRAMLAEGVQTWHACSSRPLTPFDIDYVPPAFSEECIEKAEWAEDASSSVLLLQRLLSRPPLLPAPLARPETFVICAADVIPGLSSHLAEDRAYARNPLPAVSSTSTDDGFLSSEEPEIQSVVLETDLLQKTAGGLTVPVSLPAPSTFQIFLPKALERSGDSLHFLMGLPWSGCVGLRPPRRSHRQAEDAFPPLTQVFLVDTYLDHVSPESSQAGYGGVEWGSLRARSLLVDDCGRPAPMMLRPVYDSLQGSQRRRRSTLMVDELGGRQSDLAVSLDRRCAMRRVLQATLQLGACNLAGLRGQEIDAEDEERGLSEPAPVDNFEALLGATPTPTGSSAAVQQPWSLLPIEMQREALWQAALKVFFEGDEGEEAEYGWSLFGVHLPCDRVCWHFRLHTATTSALLRKLESDRGDRIAEVIRSPARLHRLRPLFFHLLSSVLGEAPGTLLELVAVDFFLMALPSGVSRAAPLHLYRALGSSEEGVELLEDNGVLRHWSGEIAARRRAVLEEVPDRTEEELSVAGDRYAAALMAMASIGASPHGIDAVLAACPSFLTGLLEDAVSRRHARFIPALRCLQLVAGSPRGWERVHRASGSQIGPFVPGALCLPVPVGEIFKFTPEDSAPCIAPRQLPAWNLPELTSPRETAVVANALKMGDHLSQREGYAYLKSLPSAVVQILRDPTAPLVLHVFHLLQTCAFPLSVKRYLWTMIQPATALSSFWERLGGCLPEAPK